MCWNLKLSPPLQKEQNCIKKCKIFNKCLHLHNGSDTGLHKHFCKPSLSVQLQVTAFIVIIPTNSPSPTVSRMRVLVNDPNKVLHLHISIALSLLVSFLSCRTQSFYLEFIRTHGYLFSFCFQHFGLLYKMIQRLSLKTKQQWSNESSPIEQHWAIGEPIRNLLPSIESCCFSSSVSSLLLYRGEEGRKKMKF